jgi:hypothetical protein
MRRALAAVLLVALAGCSSVAVGTETSTVTPVAVPGGGTPAGGTATATPEGRLAPGLTEAGVLDPFALAGSHRTAIGNQSFTVERSRAIRDGNETLRSVSQTVQVAPGKTPYRLVRTAASAPEYPVGSATDRVELWFDGTQAVYRIGSDDPAYRVDGTPSIGGPVSDITAHDRLVTVYAGLNWRVTARDVDSVGKAFYELRADRVTDESALAVPLLVSDPRDVSARAIVTGRGRVRDFRLRYDATIDGRTVTVERTMRFRLVGLATVERPDWYDAAVNGTERTPAPRGRSPEGDG